MGIAEEGGPGAGAATGGDVTHVVSFEAFHYVEQGGARKRERADVTLAIKGDSVELALQDPPRIAYLAATPEALLAAIRNAVLTGPRVPGAPVMSDAERMLVGALMQACEDDGGHVDSGCLSFFANALRYLAARGLFVMEQDYMRVVYGRWAPGVTDALMGVKIEAPRNPTAGGAPIKPLTDDRWFEICEAMTREGGSFVQALGAAGLRADPENRERILWAFREYVTEYARRADRPGEQAPREPALSSPGASAPGSGVVPLHGPGKYDDACTSARELTGGSALLMVIGGTKGHGFSAQLLPEHARDRSGVAAVLRKVAAEIEAGSTPEAT